MDWYCILEDFQTAIVGVLGFAGVVWTLKENARLARAIENTKLQNNKTAARKAVTEELMFFRHVYENGLDSMRPEPGKVLLVPRMKRIITPNMMSDVALLDGEEARTAIKSLLMIDEIDRTLTVIASKADSNFFTIPPERYDFVRDLYADRVERLTAALNELDDVKRSAKG